MTYEEFETKRISMSREYQERGFILDFTNYMTTRDYYNRFMRGHSGNFFTVSIYRMKIKMLEFEFEIRCYLDGRFETRYDIHLEMTNILNELVKDFRDLHVSITDDEAYGGIHLGIGSGETTGMITCPADLERVIERVKALAEHIKTVFKVKEIYGQEKKM
jgi:hypothetical protein